MRRRRRRSGPTGGTASRSETGPVARLAANGAGGSGQIIFGNTNWFTILYGITPELMIARNWEIANGRGSAFIDGRYLANGETTEIAPGKHDIQVRDGDQLLAQGVLTIPRKSTGVTLTVVHP